MVLQRLVFVRLYLQLGAALLQLLIPGLRIRQLPGADGGRSPRCPASSAAAPVSPAGYSPASGSPSGGSRSPPPAPATRSSCSRPVLSIYAITSLRSKPPNILVLKLVLIRDPPANSFTLPYHKTPFFTSHKMKKRKGNVPLPPGLKLTASVPRLLRLFFLLLPLPQELHKLRYPAHGKYARHRRRKQEQVLVFFHIVSSPLRSHLFIFFILPKSPIFPSASSIVNK